MPIYQKPTPASQPRGTRPTPTCWAGCGSIGPAKSGAPISHTCRCGRASSIWSPSWTVHPQGSGRAHLEHAGGRLLRRGAEGAIHRFGAPGIRNTDQGSQFTSFAWTDRLKRIGARISMDGKGRCLDNIFIERLWRFIKL
ncbi:transposase family protein [Paracoccus methylovorus]|uniref:Transposase family protein n=1 Tax=Paracoccus methylovorus TaxID=2812658 RepID=A0ABX7JFC3_9RHOB|nr:transposase family protein [Paracoccus methylovorus]